MHRLVILALVVLVTLAVIAVSAVVHRDLSHSNDFILLYTLEPVVALLGGIAASVYLARQRDSAAGMLGVGLYSLTIGVTFITIFPLWLPQDDTILGAALVGGLLAMVGTALAGAGALTLAGRRTGMAQATGWLCGLVAFLAASSGGIIAPAAAARPQIVVLALVVIAVGLLTRYRGPAIRRALTLSAMGTLITILALIARGPGDWASASDTVKLYSFPLIVMGVAISLAILQLAAQDIPFGRGGRGVGAA